MFSFFIQNWCVVYTEVVCLQYSCVLMSIQRWCVFITAVVSLNTAVLCLQYSSVVSSIQTMVCSQYSSGLSLIMLWCVFNTTVVCFQYCVGVSSMLSLFFRQFLSLKQPLWEALSLFKRLCLSLWVTSNFCERPGFSVKNLASIWEALALCERPYMSVRGAATLLGPLC